MAAIGNTNNHDFSDPAYQTLSQKNGLINRMLKNEMIDELKRLELDTRGVKEVLKKRLKNYYKKSILKQCSPENSGPAFDFYLVIDFEATCEKSTPTGFKHEVIEFPVVLIDAHKKEKVGEFHEYVKPEKCPKLSEFCTDLTGITQSRVDFSSSFKDVLARMESWMLAQRLGQTGRDFAILTDGPWDMSRFMRLQCELSNIQYPKWALKWVNIRKAYANFYDCKKSKIMEMIESLGMRFEGNLHSGIDDSRNIARIALRLLQDGSRLRMNEELVYQQDHQGDKYPAVININSEKARNCTNCLADSMGNLKIAPEAENKPKKKTVSQKKSKTVVYNDTTNSDSADQDGDNEDLLLLHKIQNAR